LELRHLRYFVAVAEEEHMTRAAQRLNIQQPPLSKQIQQLEEEIGVPLFTRSPRKIALNAAGKLFLSDARRVLAMANEAVARVRQFNLGEEGSLRIGFTSSSSMHPLTLAIIEAFRTAYPLVSLKIEEGANHDLLYLVEQERLDIAFVRSSVERYPTLESRTLTEEEMIVALPTQHTLAAQRGVDLAEVAGESLVFYRQVNGSGIGDMLLDAFAARGLTPKIVDETQRIMAAINMVAAGFGIAIVPAALLALRLPAVVYRPLLPLGAVTVPLNTVYRRQADAETVRRFLRACDLTLARADSHRLVPSDEQK